ncbi:uncharacterized protein LOC117747697 isoform X1 [Cyclopterus lumpus]|uniref:uncharacterized protein LOC117747697 isoform X1 n=1 Tax=Cyclopterus lumpus TaxID=8103 RepID=UPI0014862606|nr:uncharacterized protein LOC117747697 isoform X1 [Cyclopterus lumpus]XP_034413106.1 uncharacterized protein LOC117747697 isoform X1 [Cyclopterus lumpus]
MKAYMHMYSVYLDYPNLLLPSNKLTMPSIGLSFFFLGAVVVSVTAIETSTGNGFTRASSTVNLSPSVTPLSVTTASSTNNGNANDTMNSTMGSSTILPFTTMQQGGASSTITTTKSNKLSKSTTTTKTIKNKRTTLKPTKSTAVDNTGIVVVVVIILVALGFGVACFFIRKRGRRASVDFTSRQDEANIPLSTVEPELPIDAVPQNGLQTFESTEKEPQEPEAKPEIQEEPKAEADTSVVESAVPTPTPDSSEDKPKEDVVEQSPPAPVEEKTDDEGVVSNETSVESLKEANENNSNNVDFSQTRDMKRIINFWDVPLNCPV